MFKAIWRLVRAFGYLITGNINKVKDVLSENPEVMRATYDNVIDTKRNRAQVIQDAIGKAVAVQEKKKNTLKTKTEEIRDLEEQKSGALAIAQERVESLQSDGKTQAEIQNDREFLEAQSAYEDFSSTLQEAEQYVAELETDIEEKQGQINDYKIELKAFLREIEKIKEEKHEAVADVQLAKEAKDAANILSGLADDSTAEDLRSLRELRTNARAAAKTAQEVSGINARREREKFRNAARTRASNNEFAKLVGLSSGDTKETETKEDAVQQTKTKIPE